MTITLDHILRFIQERLAASRPVLRSAQFGDPVLNLFKLMEKVNMEVRAIVDQGVRRGG